MFMDSLSEGGVYISRALAIWARSTRSRLSPQPCSRRFTSTSSRAAASTRWRRCSHFSGRFRHPEPCGILTSCISKTTFCVRSSCSVPCCAECSTRSARGGPLSHSR